MAPSGDRDSTLPATTSRSSRAVSPALTVIITGIYDEAWLLEIEAVAVA